VNAATVTALYSSSQAAKVARYPASRSDRLFQAIAIRSEIPAGLRNPHQCKHALASMLIRNGVGLAYVQQAMGHKHISSTVRYTQISQAEAALKVGDVELSVRMNPIKINVDEVPKDKQARADFLDLLKNMQEGMVDPVIVEAVCIHEAGHLLLAVEAKMEVQELEGPHIIYDSTQDEFIGRAANVKICVPNNTIEQCARMLAAGGIASLEVALMAYAGDQEDLVHYHDLCDQIGLKDPKLRLSVWRDAQRAVRIYLRDDSVKSAIRKIAGHLMGQLENLP
jgi:hypothetical protein